MIHYISNQSRIDSFSKGIYNSTVGECLSYLDDRYTTKNWINLDIETEGFEYLTKKPIMLQIGDKEDQFVLDIRNLNKEDILLVVRSLERFLIRGFNLKFDNKFLIYYYQFKVLGIQDCFLNELILNAGRDNVTYSLENVASRRLKVYLNKEQRNKFIDLRGRPYSISQIKYGAEDVMYLDEIYDQQEEEIVKLGLKNVQKLEFEVNQYLLESEMNGFLLDREKWLKLAHKNTLEAQSISIRLDDLVRSESKLKAFVKKSEQLLLFGHKERDILINWDSPTQCKKIFEALGLDIESTNKNDIVQYSKSYPLVKLYLEYKEKQKEVSTYGEDFLKYINEDGRVRTSYWPILSTGRLSSSNPNLQNIKRDDSYRSAFIAKEGYSIVGADYSGQEARIIAEGSGDPTWSKACFEGKDIHSLCAEVMWGDEWKNSAEDDCAFYHNTIGKDDKIGPGVACNCKKHKELRTTTKNINFMAAFLGTKYKLAQMMNISLEEADRLMQMYDKAFTLVTSFCKGNGDKAVERGYSITNDKFTRRRWTNITERSEEWEKAKARREGGNFPIQASGANMTKLAIILVCRELKRLNLDAKFLLQVHDELIFEVKDDVKDEVAQIIKSKMIEAGKHILKKIPIEVSCSINKCWSK